ncbi:RNA polymerase sigma factor [Streptomyces violascens]|uniref:RNA polymerase sigma factor n=1 Tax=Streptomyces violascens TaxID=67381 RepID=UPI0037BBF5E3
MTDHDVEFSSPPLPIVIRVDAWGAVEIGWRCADTAPELQVPAVPPQGHGSVARVTFAEFYEQHLAKLIRHLMRQGASGHEAAEAVQAAFTEAFAKWETINYPAAWLRTVARRQYINRADRHEDLVEEVPELPGGLDPAHRVELKEEEARVYAALASLPPLQSQALAWSLDGFSTAEISTALGTSPEAVRQNLHRGRARLKTILLPPNDGGGR